MATKLPLKFTPIPLRARHDGWTAEKQIAFIEALAETACVDHACRRVGMSDSSAYRLASMTTWTSPPMTKIRTFPPRRESELSELPA